MQLRFGPLSAAVLMALVFANFAQSGPARADDAAVKSVVRSQEEAISADDGDKAYSFAAPSIQAMFPDPDTFMKMVHNSYTPLYQPRVFDFGETRSVNGKIQQQVHIIDGDGVTWEAIYLLEQESDGSFKITGCILNKTEDSA
jgi:hypothetical protein